MIKLRGRMTPHDGPIAGVTAAPAGRPGYPVQEHPADVMDDAYIAQLVAAERKSDAPPNEHLGFVEGVDDGRIEGRTDQRPV
jgi:hypothetical protein